MQILSIKEDKACISSYIFGRKKRKYSDYLPPTIEKIIDSFGIVTYNEDVSNVYF
jgi:hypothetical protein